MSLSCGKAVGNLWKETATSIQHYSSNRFKFIPQLFHDLSTSIEQFSTSQNRDVSTFPQDLLLQLYILTNPLYLDGESRGSKE